MPKYKIPARFARFEDGEYVHYPAGATVELSEKEFARFATKPEPANEIPAEIVSTTGEPLPVITPDEAMLVPKKKGTITTNSAIDSE